MTWMDLTHADLVAGLRDLLTTNPLPRPRVIYATPDGRERHGLGRASQAGPDSAASPVGDVSANEERNTGPATYSEVTW